MDRAAEPAGPPEPAVLVAQFLDRAWGIGSNNLPAVVDAARETIGAESATLLVADYALMSLQALAADGPVGEPILVEGTMAGRAFARSETVVTGAAPTTVYLPLTDGSERFGVLVLAHADWSDGVAVIAEKVARLLVLLLVSKRRYTDAILRARRRHPLSSAAEIQWGLLPPLACSADGLALSGILEPAYSIGGDSFDYALNPEGVHFAVIDAVGHGMPAVLIAVAVINAVRNARREGMKLEDAYAQVGLVLEEQFGQDYYATGVLGSLDVASGRLAWLNAGHPLPLLIRDGHAHELACRPSWPMGLGGEVKEVAVERLQPLDTVLFYTDGAVDSHAPGAVPFGVSRLRDLLIAAVLDGVGPAETVRRLSESILAHNENALIDDATLLLLEYHGPQDLATVTGVAATGSRPR